LALPTRRAASLKRVSKSTNTLRGDSTNPEKYPRLFIANKNMPLNRTRIASERFYSPENRGYDHIIAKSERHMLQGILTRFLNFPPYIRKNILHPPRKIFRLLHLRYKLCRDIPRSEKLDGHPKKWIAEVCTPCKALNSLGPPLPCSSDLSHLPQHLYPVAG
jgi:hypothetical protein